jgi:hypothetical protein
MAEAIGVELQSETQGPSTSGSRAKGARAPFAQDDTGMVALRVVVRAERAMV